MQIAYLCSGMVPIEQMYSRRLASVNTILQRFRVLPFDFLLGYSIRRPYGRKLVAVIVLIILLDSETEYINYALLVNNLHKKIRHFTPSKQEKLP